MPQRPQTDIRADLIGTRQTRELRIETREVDVDARTVEIAFSSEAPVERYWGTEILDHERGAVRLDRMRDGAPLLLDHRIGQQIGVIDSARIDEDRIGRATVRFSRGPLGDEIFQDVRDGIRSKVSVGYIVHELRLEEAGDDGDSYRITDWEPLEASIVSIPADASVGVGRAHHSQQRTATMPDPALTPELDGQPVPNAEPTPTPANAPEPTPTRAQDPAPDPEPAVVNQDAAAIRQVANHFGMSEEGENQIMLGRSLAEFRDHVRTQRPDPVPSAPRVEARIPYAGTLRAFRPDLYDGGRREAEENAYRAGMFCRAVLFGDADAQRWCRDHAVQLAVANKDMRQVRVLSGVAAGQSVLVPDELILPIINLREQYGIARQRCQIHPMVSDTASVPRRTSGATAYFVGREEAPTAGDPGLDNVNLTARNVAAETRISNDYADDSAINLADFVANEHALAFATKEDNCLINGDGTNTYGGIVGIRIAILGLAGAIDAASGHDTFLEIDSDDLDGVVAALPEIPGIMPSWLASKRGEALMFGRLRTAAGGNTKSDMAGRVAKQWDGDDILISQAMPKGTGATDYSDVAMAIYGDLRMGVVFGDRRGMTMLTDPYSLSSYQQTKIISSERFDINCHGVGDASEAGPITALIGE